MKRVVKMSYYDKASTAEHGFTTEQQKLSACCIAELLEEIKKCSKRFGMLLYFISEEDMLGDRPVTIWSNMSIGNQREVFEDYILNRLKMKEQQQ